MRLSSTLILLFITITVGCDKVNEEPVLNCSNLREGILDNDTLKIKSEIDNYFSVLSSKPTDLDPFGHKENTINLVSDINKCSNIKAELLCYSCIETLPSQSEIKLIVAINRIEIVKIMDLRNSEKIEFVRIH
jgi:hypothetical protein